MNNNPLLPTVLKNQIINNLNKHGIFGPDRQSILSEVENICLTYIMLGQVEVGELEICGIENGDLIFKNSNPPENLDEISLSE